jgi:hypothetical protein
MIHHEGTKDTKATKNSNSICCFSFVFFVAFVPSW